jgi:hypothetical protein
MSYKDDILCLRCSDLQAVREEAVGSHQDTVARQKDDRHAEIQEAQGKS